MPTSGKRQARFLPVVFAQTTDSFLLILQVQTIFSVAFLSRISSEGYILYRPGIQDKSQGDLLPEAFSY